MKIYRLIGILSILLQKEKVTAAELAEKFEVSRRTVIRDIEDICKAGIPVVTESGRGGGISIMEDFKIDRTIFTSEEIQIILAGLYGLDSVAVSGRYRQIADKLLFSHMKTDGQIIIDLSVWDKPGSRDKIELIKTAMDNSEKIAFKYFAGNGEKVREIEPYHLVFQWADWYVWGYCGIREDYRLFKLSRMNDLKRTEKIQEKRNVPEYSCKRQFDRKEEVQALVKFDADLKWRIADAFGIDSLQDGEKGNIQINIKWSNKQSLFQYILSFGDKAEILSPPEYRREFAEFLNNMISKYR